MSLQDRIGSHGEFVFQALISRRCGRKFYFHPIFMGEKHPTTDMTVELLDPTRIRSLFYVQVKSTTLGYNGLETGRKLRVDITADDIENLKCYPGPTDLVGIDADKDRGFLVGVTSTVYGPINGLSTRHPLNCRNIRALWAEVDAYWNSASRPIPMATTAFTP